MALAEARAAWQRTANRCLVQEDAKRAPKLACCSSVPSAVKHAETVPNNAPAGQDIPSSNPSPFHRTPSYSNLSPNTKWWLQMQPNYVCQSGLLDEKPAYQECNFTRNGDDFRIMDRTSHVSFKEGVEESRDGCVVSSESSKSSSDLYFDSGSSWPGTEKNTPWWRTADTEELAFLVAQRSLDLIENCDLPSPQNFHVKKSLGSNARSSSCSEVSLSSPIWKSGSGGSHHSGSRESSLTTSSGGSCRNLKMVSEDHLLSSPSPKYPLRDGPNHERTCETHRPDNDAGKSQLLEALRHSQTRARQAENVAKKARAEKEHVVKLVLRQAQQLFAYKQWVQLLQLENTYYQLKNSSPAISPWTTPRKRKMQKGWMKPWSRKRGGRRSRPRYDVGKYAIVFALGFGMVGAGLLLGWTIGWMLPVW